MLLHHGPKLLSHNSHAPTVDRRRIGKSRRRPSRFAANAKASGLHKTCGSRLAGERGGSGEGGGRGRPPSRASSLLQWIGVESGNRGGAHIGLRPNAKAQAHAKPVGAWLVPRSAAKQSLNLAAPCLLTHRSHCVAAAARQIAGQATLLRIGRGLCARITSCAESRYQSSTPRRTS